MPKFVVAFISAAFALVIGFVCGALLTVSDVVKTDNKIQSAVQARDQLNSKLDFALTEKEQYQNKINILNEENEKLTIMIREIKIENDNLKEKIEDYKKLMDIRIKPSGMSTE